MCCKLGQQIFLSLQATEPDVASGKKIACIASTSCNMKSSTGGFKRSTMLSGSHLVSSIDTVYVHSLNLLLMLFLITICPFILLSPCLNIELWICYQLGVVFYPAPGEERTCEHWVFTHILRYFQTICTEMGKIHHEFLRGLMKNQVLCDLGGDYEFFFSLRKQQ